MKNSPPVRPGITSITLLSIIVITAAWWALAFWPAGAVHSAWLARTRAICFGSTSNGLPDVGGWIVLVGEPLGMLGALFAVWGTALRTDLQRLYTVPFWRATMGVVALASILGVVKVSQHVATIAGVGESFESPSSMLSSMPTRVDIDASSHILVDQHGRATSLADFAGQPVILTFAFGHCSTVCPMIVHDVKKARDAANRPDIPIVVITLDPWRDSPPLLPQIATSWELAEHDRVLSGSVDDVNRALDALQVQRHRDERTGDVEHASVIMATDTRGHVAWRLDGSWGRLSELFRKMGA
jgi:cytochrome oxidase Cu insertion factor (SCO1/SenC/PrrC family)